MKDPLISVIIPVYNACTYLEDCIASVIRQTMSEQIEIILIDDGSTDGSSAIADHAACSFQNMTVLHTVNHGVSAARNLGLAQAKGTYVSFVDADDYIEADYYESMLAALPPDAALVSCSFTAEYDNKQVLHAGGRCRSICGEAIIKSFLQETVLTPVVADKLFLREKVGNYGLMNPCCWVRTDGFCTSTCSRQIRLSLCPTANIITAFIRILPAAADSVISA